MAENIIAWEIRVPTAWAPSCATVPTGSTSMVNARYTQPLGSVAECSAADTDSIADDAYRYTRFLLPRVRRRTTVSNACESCNVTRDSAATHDERPAPQLV